MVSKECCIVLLQVSRKLAFVEDELEGAEDRVKSGDSKVMELEEELKVTRFTFYVFFQAYTQSGTKCVRHS